MNYREALEFIHSTSWLGSRPGLSRIAELANLLGNPQRGLRFIHTAGTNGKGSFCKMTETILREAGYRTGLFISPYIRTFNERMCVNGENISDGELAEITEFVKPYAESMTDPPTEFELVTAIAFEYFRRNRCDIVVLETGMGGRLDSTNVIESPVMSVITGIALDHTSYLGDTTEKIAFEKAGIIKSGSPVLFGGKDAEALNVIAKTAEEKNSKLCTADYSKLKNIRYSLTGTIFDFGDFKDIYIPLLGVYQPENAALVLTGIDILKEQGFEITDRSVYDGLKNTVWEGRFEILSENPMIIIDGSHNPQGLRATADSIKLYFGDTKLNIVTGVMEDKNYLEMIDILTEIALSAYVVSPNNPRALSSSKYSEAIREKGIPAQPFESVSDAVKRACSDSEISKTPVLTVGSLYMYADAKAAAEEYTNSADK